MTERERFEAWARPRWSHPEDLDRRIKAIDKYMNFNEIAEFVEVADKVEV